MLTALLFDLDGTLTDTDTLHLQAFRHLMEEQGRTLSQAEFEAKVSGRANGELFAELFAQSSPEQQKALADRKEALFRALSPRLEPMPGLLRLLEHAQAQAIGVCVVTNAPRLNAEHMLNAMGLGGHFEHILVAEELARAKPDPLPYLTGLQRLDATAGQALAFEDSLPGVTAASRAGIFTVGLATSLPAERLLAAGAQRVIDDFNDPLLWALIDEMRG
ncbi:MAG: HAD-superfamily hydrolase, subfamily variant 3 [Pseudomonas sp.]|jgi:HAD superfamily hydrolase (TIGR01509 family)|nr:HAD-superfamily hydrolase, subfamily variant 3 [Pseudomonas sp.]